MPITLEQCEWQYVIHLEGEINITIAMELKQLLVRGLGEAKVLRVDVQRATELDITALQLLWVAGREAQKLNVDFSAAGSVPEVVLAAATAAGFEKFPVPTETKELSEA